MKTTPIPLMTSFFDGHLHLRQGNMLNLVLPHTTKTAYGGVIMPNIDPPILSINEAKEYEQSIQRTLPQGSTFQPLLTHYLTDFTDASFLIEGFRRRAWHAAKMYPAMGTTNATKGVTSIEKILPVLEAMEEAKMPLLIHGELIDDKEDPLNFETNFLLKILEKEILYRFPKLKVVLEHITTAMAAEFIFNNSSRYDVWATVTPQHLLFEHRHLFQAGRLEDKSFKRGLRPRFWCMPILKFERDRLRILEVIASGCKRIGAGTDSAPHPIQDKYKDIGCGGCFTSPYAVEMYAMALSEANALHLLPDFLGVNIPQGVYGIIPPEPYLELVREDQQIPENVTDGSITVEHLLFGETIPWSVKRKAA